MGFNRHRLGQAFLLTSALVVWLSGCSINTGTPDGTGGSNTGVNIHTHTWGEWTELTPATCGVSGVEMRTCTQDASHKDVRTTPPLTGVWCNATGGGVHTHTWGDWVITTPATCNAQGAETRTCTQDASHKEVRTVPQLTGAECNPTSGGEHTHTWGNWVVTTPATCDATGVETRTCARDASHKEVRTIPQLTGAECNSTDGGEHVHTWGEWAITLQPTCEETGMEMRLCTQDPRHRDLRGIQKLTGAACNSTGGGDHVHTWGNWVVTTPAICDATGVETRTCTQDASHKETRAIARLTDAVCNYGDDHVHTWGAWMVTIPATCNKPGVETRTCMQNANHKDNRLIAQLTGAACNSVGGGTSGTVTIGGIKWMTKNLDVQTADSWCYGEGSQVYDDNTGDWVMLTSSQIQANCAKYGRLYTWEAAKSACQSIGKRLPTNQEWEALVTAAGGSSTAGKKLKSMSGWNNNGNGTNDFGFSALPGGGRSSGGGFDNVGNYGGWWTATESGSYGAYYRVMGYDYDGVYYNNFNKSLGFSVRCVEN